jgi:hypothetical protein
MSHYSTYLQSLRKAEQDASTARQQALAADTRWQALWAEEGAQMEAALQTSLGSPSQALSGSSAAGARRPPSTSSTTMTTKSMAFPRMRGITGTTPPRPGWMPWKHTATSPPSLPS